MAKILIVEDEAIIALSTKKSIEKMGHTQVTIVDSGEKAIQFVKENQPTIILMDLKINGDMDGIETMEEIRKFSDVPVIYTTGNSDPRARERANATTKSSFLTKPIENSILHTALQKYLFVFPISFYLNINL
ncbi:MAG: response regulator [Bacteroidetes bacterium]|nr:response regulator [Bacteroidota bacterium]